MSIASIPATSGTMPENGTMDSTQPRPEQPQRRTITPAQKLAYLQPEDMLYVPKTKLASAAELSRQLADVVLFQGFGFSFSYRVDNKESND